MPGGAQAAVRTGEAHSSTASISKPSSRSPSRVRPAAAASVARCPSRPVSSSWSTAASSAAMALVGIVAGCGCQSPQVSRYRRQVARLRYQPAAFGRPSSRASQARSPTATGATPTGPPRHLLATVTQASIPHPSMSISTPPSEETASTSVRTPRSRATPQISRTGLSSPRSVSWWTTASARVSGRASSSALTASAKTGRYPSGRSRRTSSPRACPMVAARSAKKPPPATSTGSPRASRLPRAISTPARPGP